MMTNSYHSPEPRLSEYLMRSSVRRRAFTLIELLVVIAIIALLISILIPSLQAAREQGKRAKCLANIRSIAGAMHTYSSDDSRAISFAVQPIYGDYTTTGRTYAYAEFLFVSWWTWGGRDATVSWNLGVANYYVRAYNDANPPQLESNPDHWKLYAAKHRPLNQILYPRGISIDGKERFELPLFECPSDVGYPDDAPWVGEEINDAPRYARKVRCYDGLGNSYRGSFASLNSAPSARARAWMTFGPAAHKMDTLANTADMVWFGEPLFFNRFGAPSALGIRDGILYMPGWHKRRGVDNLAFVDGSGRSTEVGQTMVDFDANAREQMGMHPGLRISRGQNWRLDCYPTPGAALIEPYAGHLAAVSDGIGTTYWPGRGFQYNFAPR
jgi:prepilin-type N-terminal cleavage/methylation domain-containing protein